MARTNEDRWQPTTRARERDASPWVASGAITSSAVVKNAAGILGGVLVTTTDAGGDIDVLIYDSPDSTLTTGDEILARVRITEATTGAQASFAAPAREGVQALNGLYVDITGDCQVIVYYK